MAGLAPPFNHITLSSMTTSADFTRPRSLKRSASAISLPSPPEELETGPSRPPYIDLSSGRAKYSDEDESGLNASPSIRDDDELDNNLQCSRARRQHDAEDEIDELESDVDMLDEDEHVVRLGGDLAASRNPFQVGSPGSAARERERQAEVSAAAASASARPDHPQASPTHVARGAAARRRRKHDDVEKIHVNPRLGHDSLSAKGTVRHPPTAMGADDLANPFIDRPQDTQDQAGKRARWRKGQAVRPDKVTYVFRGKRITYDVPLSALLAPEDPSESPFAEPSPRLLFPSKSTDPITPPSQLRFGATTGTAATGSSFLEALRASSAVKSDQQGQALPPTPVTQKRPGRQDRDRAVEEEVPEQRIVYKRMRMDSGGDDRSTRGLRR